MKYMILYENHHLIQETAPTVTEGLAANVSTDEIYPVKYSHTFKDFGNVALTGFRSGQIWPGDVAKAQCSCLLSGDNIGCGSAREHAAITLYDAGIRLVYAPSFNAVFRRNLINCGCIPTSHYEAILAETINVDQIPDLSDYERSIIKNGGFMAASIIVSKGPHPLHGQTLTEKILSRAAGESCFSSDIVTVTPDLVFFYDVHTPLINRALGEGNIVHPRVLAFDDHFGRNPKFKEIVNLLDDFTARHQIKTYFTREDQGGICHAVMLEEHVQPGQLIIGTDSHTATCGVSGALGLAVGATELAAVLKHGQLSLVVPEAVAVTFTGTLSAKCTIKDVMLYLLGSYAVKNGQTRGRFLEFDISNIDVSYHDQLSVLCNMSTEADAWGGIAFSVASAPEHRPDEDAAYAYRVEIDLGKIKPAVAFPHHPAEYRTISAIVSPIKIHKVFIGSCTGGLMRDIEVVATQLSQQNVNPTTTLFVQPATYAIYHQAEELGYLDIINQAGGTVLLPGCGGCLGQPPAFIGDDENGVWNTNRNFQGRMGSAQGKVYLASTEVALFAAITGFLSRDFDEEVDSTLNGQLSETSNQEELEFSQLFARLSPLNQEYALLLLRTLDFAQQSLLGQKSVDSPKK